MGVLGCRGQGQETPRKEMALTLSRSASEPGGHSACIGHLLYTLPWSHTLSYRVAGAASPDISHIHKNWHQVGVRDLMSLAAKARADSGSHLGALRPALEGNGVVGDQAGLGVPTC